MKGGSRTSVREMERYVTKRRWKLGEFSALTLRERSFAKEGMVINTCSVIEK